MNFPYSKAGQKEYYVKAMSKAMPKGLYLGEAPNIIIDHCIDLNILLRPTGVLASKYVKCIDSILSAAPNSTLIADTHYYWEGKELSTCIQLWDVYSKECLIQLNGSEDNIKDLVFSPDSSKIISSSRVLNLWDVNAGSLLTSIGECEG